MIKLLATDLDRTLLPNGDHPYDGSMPKLKDILDKNNIKIAFVSGRHLELVREAMEKYKTPYPDYIISDVGTTIYVRKDSDFERNISWDDFIRERTTNWNIELFKEKLSGVSGLTIQEESKQNIFKLSYYIDNLSLSGEIVKSSEKIIKEICDCKDAVIIYSVDETIGQGLLDVLPVFATKQRAIEYLREELGISMDELMYSGDSGNDILALTQGYYSVMVRNTIKEVQDLVFDIAKKKGFSDRVYLSKGTDTLNGYYVSGIIEGMEKFGFISNTI